MVRALAINHHRLQGKRSYPGEQIDWSNPDDPYLPKEKQTRADLEKTLPILVALDLTDALLGNDRNYLLDINLTPEEHRRRVEESRIDVRADFGADKQIFDIVWNRVKEIFSTRAYYP